MSWLYVALGGAAGSLLRYAAGQALGPGRPGAFPWHTFGVNVAGSLLLGIVVALAPRDDPHHLRALLAVGFCGGLTTVETLWMGVPLVSLAADRFAGTRAARGDLSKLECLDPRHARQLLP